MTVLGTTWHKFIKHRYVYRETLPFSFIFLIPEKKGKEGNGKNFLEANTSGGKKNGTKRLRYAKKPLFLSFFFLYLTLWTKIVNLALGLVTIRASSIFREGSGRIFSLPRKILYFRKSEKLLKRSFGKRTG